MSNRTIVAIAVHPKLNIGDRYWYVDLGSSCEITLITKPYWCDNYSLDGGDWWIKYIDKPGNVIEDNLGDMGVPGFTYDDRPCRLVQGANDNVDIHIKAYRTWSDLNTIDDYTLEDGWDEYTYTDSL